jgi:acetoacetyl-CoA synthetase
LGEGLLSSHRYADESDGVLNPSGVRFGSAEIYAIIEKFPQLQDAICVGQRRPHDQDENVLLFLKLQPDIKLTPQFTEQVKDAIRQGLSARHVPKYVFQVQDIPYTYGLFRRV